MAFQQNYNQDLPYIPYNSENKDYSRFNRKNPTKAESLMWNNVLKWDKTWYRFVRQKTLWWFIADFYYSELLLWIEIDWWYHNEFQDYDNERSNRLYNNYGIKIIRFTNEEVKNNMEWIVQYLKETIKEREKEI